MNFSATFRRSELLDQAQQKMVDLGASEKQLGLAHVWVRFCALTFHVSLRNGLLDIIFSLIVIPDKTGRARRKMNPSIPKHPNQTRNINPKGTFQASESMGGT